MLASTNGAECQYDCIQLGINFDENCLKDSHSFLLIFISDWKQIILIQNTALEEISQQSLIPRNSPSLSFVHWCWKWHHISMGGIMVFHPSLSCAVRGTSCGPCSIISLNWSTPSVGHLTSWTFANNFTLDDQLFSLCIQRSKIWLIYFCWSVVLLSSCLILRFEVLCPRTYVTINKVKVFKNFSL